MSVHLSNTQRSIINSSPVNVPFLKEEELRRWARDHYVPPALRHPSWNPVFLQEMARIDQEILERELRGSRLYSLVPLEPGDFYRVDPCQAALKAPKMLMSIPTIARPAYYETADERR